MLKHKLALSRTVIENSQIVINDSTYLSDLINQDDVVKQFMKSYLANRTVITTEKIDIIGDYDQVINLNDFRADKSDLS